MGYKVVILLAVFAIGCETQATSVDNTIYVQNGYGFAAAVRAYHVYIIPDTETPDKQIPNNDQPAPGIIPIKAAEPPPEPEPLTPQPLPEFKPEPKPEPVKQPVAIPDPPHLPETTVHAILKEDVPLLPEIIAEPPSAIKEMPRRWLYFKGPNCAYCELFEKGSKNPDGTVKDKAYVPWFIAGGWLIGLDINNHIQKIDGDKDIGMTSKYRVTSYPTFVLLDNDKEITRLVGYQKGEKLVQMYNDKGTK